VKNSLGLIEPSSVGKRGLDKVTPGSERMRGGLSARVGSLGYDAIVSLAGTGIARLISFVGLLLIVRVYSSADFGSWVVILTLAGLVQPFATLRYDIAVVIAPTRRIAAALTVVVAGQTLIMMAVILACVLLAPGWLLIAASGLEPQQLNLLHLVPLVILLLPSQTLLQAWLTRERNFNIIAASQIVQAMGTALAMLLAGWWLGASPHTAAAGAITGLGLATIVAATASRNMLGYVRLRGLARCAWSSLKRYKVYPLYLVPYSLSAVLSERLLQITLASSYSLSVLGAFFVARQVVSSPFIMLQDPLRRVVFAHSARDASAEQVKERVLRVLALLTHILCPVIGLGTIWLKPILATVLDSSWFSLPDFAQWALLPAAIGLYSGWLDRILDVLGKQKAGVFLQVSSDAVLLFVVVVGARLGMSALPLIATRSIMEGAVHLFWLVVVLRQLGTGWHKISGLVAHFLTIAILWSAVHYALKLLMPSPIAFGASTILLMITFFWVFVRSAGVLRFGVKE
jgi:O-antigen/teichoic acid export membrane protein